MFIVSGVASVFTVSGHGVASVLIVSGAASVFIVSGGG